MRRIARQAETFAIHMAEASVKLYRGLNLDSTVPGMEKVHQILQTGNWDHPDLGGHILDALHAGPKKGLGNHWSADPAQAERFASWPNEETGRGGNLQAVIEGEWNGRGEDLGRTDTHEFDGSGEQIRSFPEEQERTLSPGASVNVTGVKIRPYDDEYWNGPDDGSPVDPAHDGPWHHVFGQPSMRSAALSPEDMDNLQWDWAKGKWVPRQDPDDPVVPHREEKQFDYDRHWPGWENREWEKGRRSEAAYEDYAGHHQAPGPHSGFPITHMIDGMSDSDLGGVPADWLTHPHYYTSGEVSSRSMKQTQQLYNRVNGKPDEMVDIYRALPHGNTDFNTGDWVTPSLEYAKGHAAQGDDPSQDWPVIKTTVPAKHLWQNGDSYYEMGYHGPSHKGTVAGGEA